MLAQCLAGVRVLDLSTYLPGPLATLWLSDLGATVVKVESPAGDPMRTMGGIDPDGTTPYYKLVNRNKTVVLLDLKTAPGQAELSRLITRADILVDGFRPGVLDRLGFPPAHLDGLNPRLIRCALSGYGATGPFRDRAGHDVTYLAASGLLAGNGPAERPVMGYPPLADHAGAMLAFNAILAALIARGQSGRGTTLDVSLTEAALAWMGGVLTMARRGQTVERETDLINGGAACYRIYRAACGGFAALAALEPKFWSAFCHRVGRPDWIARQDEPRPQHGLIAELEALFASRPLSEWSDVLDSADCTFEPVLDPASLPDHPHHRARGIVTAAADGIVDVMLPILADGAALPRRRPLVEVPSQEVTEQWF